MAGRFDDRFEASTYRNDPLTGIFPTGDPDAGSGVWMPERILVRLVDLGRAYDLHRLSLLYGEDGVTLNTQQLEGLIEELEFVTNLTTDPLVRLWGNRAIELARQVASAGGSLTVLPG